MAFSCQKLYQILECAFQLIKYVSLFDYFEQVNVYLQKFGVWSLKLFDSRGDSNSFIRYLFK